MRISTTAAAAALGLSLLAAPAAGAQTAVPDRAGELEPAASAQRYKCLIWWKTTKNYSGYTAGYSWAWNKVVKRGAHGNRVKEIQCLLNYWSEVAGEKSFDPGSLDGIFGKDTKRAVKAYQHYWDIEDDGIVGPETWRYLR